MRFLSIIALACALVGCAASPRPSRARLESDNPRLEIALGANAWHRVGLTAGYEDDPETPECSATLREDCELAVRVVLVEGLRYQQTGDGRAIARSDVDARLIEIDAGISGRRLAHIAAHELAHVVFGCDHLDVREDPSGVGIMARTPTEPWIIEPTDADYNLACRSAGYCLD